MNLHLISGMILLPFVGAVFQVFPPFGRKRPGASTSLAFLTSLLSSLLGFALVLMLASGSEERLHESFVWIGSFLVRYDVAVDGLNALPVVLVSTLFPVLLGSELRRGAESRASHGMLLLLQSAVLGTVCAQDIFVAAFFWCFSTVPIYFLVALWGKPEERESTASRYILASSVSNVLLLLTLILVYFAVDPHTFLLKELGGGKLDSKQISIFGADISIGDLAFVLFSLGVVFRVPVFPLQSWFSQLARTSPPVVMAVMSGALVPVSLFVYMRFGYTLFPRQIVKSTDALLVVGALNFVAGALRSVVQKDLLLLMGQLTLSFVGVLLVGLGSLNATGLSGAIYLGASGGLAFAGLGLFASLLDQNLGSSEFSEADGKSKIGGLARMAPFTAVFVSVLLIAVLGFPGTGNFVGQSLVFMGGALAQPAVLMAFGIGFILMTVGVFTFYRNVFLGPALQSSEVSFDVKLKDKVYWVPLLVMVILLGLYPRPLLDLMRPGVEALLAGVTVQ